MPLTDAQAKAAYDSTLQEPEEQRKYWDVVISVTTLHEIRCFGTEEEAKVFAMSTIKREQPHIGAEYSVESIEKSDIFEQEGE